MQAVARKLKDDTPEACTASSKRVIYRKGMTV